MGALWALVCHHQGQLLKIQAWGQPRGWMKEQDPPHQPSWQLYGVINTS